MILLVTVYTTGPTCVMCTATKRAMEKRGIAYVEVPLQNCPSVLAYAQEKGWTNAPVVRVWDEADSSLVAEWSGFNLNAIKALARMKEDHVL